MSIYSEIDLWYLSLLALAIITSIMMIIKILPIIFKKKESYERKANK